MEGPFLQEFVQELRQRRPRMMTLGSAQDVPVNELQVDDGVNDAPALVQSDLGVAGKFGFLFTPAAAAVLMSISSLIVAVNARLLRIRPTG